MYKLLNIDGEEYKLEFSIEASLRNECIEKITGMMASLASADDRNELKETLKGLSNIPNVALECFYSGLLEHHGYSGDGRVRKINDAKALVVSLFRDEESGISNWNDVLTLCVEQMSEDGFFELIGLVDNKKKAPKQPQDHKKKATRKVSEIS